MFVYGLHAKATLIHILDEKSKPKIPKTLCNTYTTSNLYVWVAIENLEDAPANRKPCKKCFQ